MRAWQHGRAGRRGPVVAVMMLLAATAVGLVGPAGQAATSGPPALVHRAVTPCPAGRVCVTATGDQTLGPARTVADGFVSGIDNTDSRQMVSALGARSWLMANGDQAYGSARAAHAVVTSIVSDAWSVASYVPGHGPQAPWDNFPAFYSFTQSLVRASKANGQPVDYWEVQNEPDGYFGTSRPTPGQALEEFRIGVSAVRSVDPKAKIVGPALSAWNDNAASPTLDMVTFLDYIAANHIQVDALAWHEVGARASLTDTTPDPYSVIVHVQRLRQLLAARPSLGRPAIMITEYGSAAVHLIGGWAVGWIGAIESAGVQAADRACWHSSNLAGQWEAECHHGALDGLFVPDSGLPQAVYWVYRFYASMTGWRVGTSSTDPNVTAFATRNDTTRTLQVMVGRHQSCTPGVRVDCQQPAAAMPAPVPVDVHLAVPYQAPAVTVTLQLEANNTGVDLGPETVWTETVPLGPGPIVVPISRFTDGDAYLITVSAGSA